MKLLYAEDERALSEAVCDILTYHSNSFLTSTVRNERKNMIWFDAYDWSGAIIVGD